MTKLLKGKPLAQQVTAYVKEALQDWQQQTAGFRPKLVSVLASDDSASEVYARSKARRAERLGVEYEIRNLGAEATQEELNAALRELSQDKGVHGIMLEFPLADGLDAGEAFTHLSRRKDLEGLTPDNLARIAARDEETTLLPPTPHSVRALLSLGFSVLGQGDGGVRGKRVAVVGPGMTVGRPLIWMLINAGATVTVISEATRDVPAVLREQDAVVVAVGKRGLLRPEQLQPHQVVVDAGINVTEDGNVFGDAAPEVSGAVAALTPVPGGVGPLTSALMFLNMVRAVQLQRGETPAEFQFDFGAVGRDQVEQNRSAAFEDEEE